MASQDSALVAPRRFTPKIVGGTAYVQPEQPKRESTRRISREGEDPIFAAIENHRSAAAEMKECYDEAERLIGRGKLRSDDYEPYTQDSFDEYWNTLEELAKTLPSTAPGVMAMLIYIREVNIAKGQDFFAESCLFDTLIETMATAADALIRRTAS